MKNRILKVINFKLRAVQHNLMINITNIKKEKKEKKEKPSNSDLIQFCKCFGYWEMRTKNV